MMRWLRMEKTPLLDFKGFTLTLDWKLNDIGLTRSQCLVPRMRNSCAVKQLKWWDLFAHICGVLAQPFQVKDLEDYAGDEGIGTLTNSQGGNGVTL